MIKTLSIIVLGCLLCSCTAVMSKLYGVKELEEFDEKEYQSFVDDVQKQLPSASFIISTTEQYEKQIHSGKDSTEMKNLGQPVQILYFDNKILRSYHINCYAKGGLLNINWNTDDRFSSFLPKSAVDCSKGDVSLERFAEIYPEIDTTSNKRYTILLFWTNMLRKISLSAATTVADNLKQHQQDSNCNIYFICSDKFFVEYQ